MKSDKRYLVDIDLKNLPFPIKVESKYNIKGQDTVSNISVNARLMREFEATSINQIIKIIHQHRNNIGPRQLGSNIVDYLLNLNATMIKIDLQYPFFIEKITPVSKEKSLMSYNCTQSLKKPIATKTNSIFKIDIPVITSYPINNRGKSNLLFGQQTMVNIEIISSDFIYPEDIVEAVDKHALAPVYSYLNEEDEEFLINKIHTERIDSVVLADEIKNELSKIESIEWCAVKCSNFGMLHSYSTIVSTDKNIWLPEDAYNE